MAVLKEFSCKAHGPFEEMVEQDVTPECPKGCSPRWVTREIRTAPAARNVVTGKMDGLQRDLAHDFGLSDLKVDKEGGKSVMQNLQSSQDFSPKWVDVPTQMKSGWSQRGEKPAAIDVGATFGLQGGNALPSKPLPKPTPIIQGSYKADIPSV